MALTAGMWRSISSLGLCVGATIAAANAQPSTTQTAVRTAPSTAAVSGTDTAHLVLQRTPNGVRFAFRERGTGPLAKYGSRVVVRYTGFLPDGHLFDATAASEGPLRFRVGRGEVIPGWDELLLLVPAGSHVRAWIPAALAYGTTGVRDPDDSTRFIIPPNTELVFELRVMSVR